MHLRCCSLFRLSTSFLMFSISFICSSIWSLKCLSLAGSIVSFRTKSTFSWNLFPIPRYLSRSTTAALMLDQILWNSALHMPPAKWLHSFLASRIRSMLADTDLSVESGMFPQPLLCAWIPHTFLSKMYRREMSISS